jgi:Negative regulator of beta-lactamase expression
MLVFIRKNRGMLVVLCVILCAGLILYLNSGDGLVTKAEKPLTTATPISSQDTGTPTFMATPVFTATPIPTPALSLATETPIFDPMATLIRIDAYCNEYRTDGGPEKLQSITTMTFVPNSTLVDQTLLSCNYRARAGKPVIAIVVHDTVGPIQNTIAHFERPAMVAAQYVIGRDGKVVQMVPEELAALQVNPYSKGPCLAGQNCLIRQITNNNSIGIELENLYDLAPVPGKQGLYENRYGDQTSDVFVVHTTRGDEYYQAYTPAQIHSLVLLVHDIVTRNPSIQVIVGHEEVNDKLDPGPAFNQYWPLLRDAQLQPLAAAGY